MSPRVQRACVWCVVPFALLFFIGFGPVAGFIPPPDPSDTAAEIAHRYRSDSGAIRIGMLLTMYALVLYIPWVATLSAQLKRVEGRHTPLSHAQLALGAMLPVALFPALYFFQAAAFRSERSDESIQQLNDMGWLPFTGLIYTVTMQTLVTGILVLTDRRTVPVFPRWYAYFCFWCALLYCPASLDVFFLNGPLAWDGILSWWMSVIAYFAWVLVTSWALLGAISHQEAEESGVAAPATVGIEK